MSSEERPGVLKGRDLNAFATIVRRRATCPRIFYPKKKSVKRNVTTSKKEMKDE